MPNKRHTVVVKVLKDLPRCPKGTILKKLEKGPVTGDWMTPECIDSDGKYINSQAYLHHSDFEIDQNPDFFERIYCGCECYNCKPCCCSK